MFDVPAHSLVHITVYNFDGASGLRNPFLSQVEGTVGGDMRLNGKTTKVVDPDDSSHTFYGPAVRGLGADQGRCRRREEPVRGDALLADKAHETITFTIRTGKPGRYRWQCFVPCAAGFIDGFGGPDADDRLHGRLPPRDLSDARMSEPNHFRRILILWLVLSVVATPIVVARRAARLPPGQGDHRGLRRRSTDNTVLLGIATPIAALILVYFAYTLIVFRRRDGAAEEGVAVRGDSRIVVTWLVVTSAIVALRAPHTAPRACSRATGSGGGQGPDPIAKPSGGPAAAGAGDRPAVELDLPLPVLRRRGDAASRASRSARTWSCTSPRST